MKMMQSILSKVKYVLFAILLTFSFACNPDDGEDGAPGPPGEQGPQGEPGEDGNTDIESSEWISFNTSEWSNLQSESGFVFRTFSVDVPEMDQDMINGGIVLVYLRHAQEQEVHELPFTGLIGSNPNEALTTIDYYFTLNQLTFKLNQENHTSDPGFVNEDWEYRYVLIRSGGIIETGSSFLYELSYEEVLEHYGI